MSGRGAGAGLGRAVRRGSLGLLLSLSPPAQPLGAGHGHGVERQEPRQPCPVRRGESETERRPPSPSLLRPRPTQELLGGPGELRAAAQPVAQPLQVEPRHLLAVRVGQRVQAAELLQVLPVAGAPAVGRHDAEERPVGAAPQREADDDVAATAPQEAAPCGESAGRSRPGRARRGRSGPTALTELHHGGGTAHARRAEMT